MQQLPPKVAVPVVDPDVTPTLAMVAHTQAVDTFSLKTENNIHRAAITLSDVVRWYKMNRCALLLAVTRKWFGDVSKRLKGGPQSTIDFELEIMQGGLHLHIRAIAHQTKWLKIYGDCGIETTWTEVAEIS